MIEFKEYEDSNYYVSKCGLVKGRRGHILKPSLNHKGYQVVYLSLGQGKRLTGFIHRLVAKTYIPNPDNLPEVNHIDGDKLNNNISNLEWVTSKQNKKHAMDVLGQGFGETHSQAQLTEAQVRRVCELIVDKYRSIDIAKITNIYIEKIRSIRKKQSWKHVTCEYDFPDQTSDHGMSDATFLWICHLLEEGVSGAEICRRCKTYKLSPQSVSGVKQRHTRPHLSKDFNF